MFLVMTTRDSVLDELIAIEVDRKKAEAKFLEVCSYAVSNWNECYTAGDKETILERGYQCGTENRVVMYIDTSNCITDQKLRQILSPDSLPVTVAKVIQTGELPLKPGMTMDEVLEDCCGNLDHACAHDIQGCVLFEGSDGKMYTVTTESHICEARPDWAQEMIDDYNERQ